MIENVKIGLVLGELELELELETDRDWGRTEAQSFKGGKGGEVGNMMRCIINLNSHFLEKRVVMRFFGHHLSRSNMCGKPSSSASAWSSSSNLKKSLHVSPSWIQKISSSSSLLSKSHYYSGHNIQVLPVTLYHKTFLCLPSILKRVVSSSSSHSCQIYNANCFNVIGGRQFVTVICDTSRTRGRRWGWGNEGRELSWGQKIWEEAI